jgi:hypothetical protein
MRTVVTLLVATALVALLGPILEGRERSAERTVRGYLQSIQRGDVTSALDAIEPSVRADWRIFAEHQAGDAFRILSLSVQRTPLISGPLAWSKTRSVTLVAEIDGKGGEHWRATSHIAGRSDGDRWYAERPPFGPDEPWLVPPEP